MKCIVCNGEHLVERTVDEEIKRGTDVIMVQVSALVCSSCGERYYSREAVQRLEKVQQELGTASQDLQEIGKVFRLEKGTEAHVA